MPWWWGLFVWFFDCLFVWFGLVGVGGFSGLSFAFRWMVEEDERKRRRPWRCQKSTTEKVRICEFVEQNGTPAVDEKEQDEAQRMSHE